MGQPLFDGEPLPSGPLAGKRVEWAGQDEIKRLGPEIDRILEALGYPESFVTDLSRINDFPLADADPDGVSLADLSVRLGVPVAGEDFLIDVGWRLRQQARG